MLQEENQTKEILELSCTEFALEIGAGTRQTAQFQIHATKYVFGDIYSSDTRVRNIQKHFEGNSTIDVEINGENLINGESLNGDFCIITNIGEYSLPFRIQVSYPQLVSSKGEIKNLFHFTNLAREDWDDAVRLFYDPDFASIFEKKDEQYLPLYRGLSKTNGNPHNVEEFLIGISKKLPIDYQLDTDGVILEDVYTSLHEFIHLKKSTWGYTDLFVEKEGDFFKLSHSHVSSEDFDNLVCTIDFYVDASKLKPGLNLGSIRIHDTKTNLCIPVRISMQDVDKEKKTRTPGVLDYQLQIIHAYLNSKMGLGTEKENDKVVKRAIDAWIEEDEENLRPQLYRVQMLLRGERFNEAQWYLDEIGNILRKEETDPVTKCYYYYLSTLYNRDENYLSQVINVLENTLGKNQKLWEVAILLLYLKEDLQKNPERKWDFLEEQFENGCISPMLYAEAISLLEEEPTLLLKLDSFEQQVIWFGVKTKLIQKRLFDQIVYVAGKVSGFSNLIYIILKKMYEREESEELLIAICRLLILGCKTGVEYFYWYKLAVSKAIRLTGLYEYYMYSMDKDGKIEIPKILLLYFSYQSQLEARESAILYRYVIENLELEPEIAISYKPLIERFCIDQIKARKISEDLAFIYENVVVPQMLRDEAAFSFTSLLFMHEIKIDNPNITSVVLIQDRMKGESTYPVTDGVCMLPIYTEDYVLFLQDEQGNRFSKSILYKNQILMDYESVIPDIRECLEGRPNFDFYECEKEHSYIAVNKNNYERVRRIVDSEQIEDSLKAELRTKLLHFYYEEDKITQLDSFLDEIDDVELSSNERSEFMRYLITRGKFDKAYLWLKKYGASGVNQKNIARLVSRRIQTTEYMEDNFLITMSYFVFRKAKYDEATLKYLVKYYCGRVRDLTDIWRNARDLELPCTEIKERILRQMLVTGELVPDKNDLLLSYLKDEEHSEQLVEQYFENIAHDFFLDDVLVENDVLDAMFTRCRQNDLQISKLQKMALLKYWSMNEEHRIVVEPEIIEEFLLDLYKDNMYFAFFKDLADYSTKLHFMKNKIYIEYHTKNKCKVKLYYYVDEATSLENGEELDEPRCEELVEMYEGIYVRECTLFAGEILQYYIAEEVDGVESITYSYTIHPEYEEMQNEEGRFGKLNDICISMEMQDDTTAKKLMEDYLHEDYVARELFRTI